MTESKNIEKFLLTNIGLFDEYWSILEKNMNNNEYRDSIYILFISIYIVLLY